MLLARGAMDGTESTNTKRIEISYVASIKKHASLIFLANGYTDDAPNYPPEPEIHQQTTTVLRMYPRLFQGDGGLVGNVI